MFFSAVVSSALLLAGTATAQYNYGSGAAASSSAVAQAQSATATYSSAVATGTSGGEVAVHVVKVSNKNGSLTYTPNDIKATVGSMIQFHFYPKNHTVTQSTFDQPCEPLANNQPGSVGFFSGFMPVAADATVSPTFTIVVNDTKPIWFYCSQGKHCQAGMVGVINAPAANTSRNIDTFKALAAKAPVNLAPGQSDGSSSSTGGSSTGSTGSTGGAGSTTTSAGPVAATGANAAGRLTAATQVFSLAVLFGMGVALL